MIRRISALIVTAFVATGCASSKTDTAQAELPPEPTSRRADDASKTETATGDLRQALLHLRRVHFAYDSAAILPSGRDALEEAAERLANHPNVAIYIEGHADKRGDSAYNVRLGDRRAQAVSAFLVKRGIAAERLNVVSYGFDQPLVAGAGARAMASNRRADFRLMRGEVELVVDEGTLVDDAGRVLGSRAASL